MPRRPTKPAHFGVVANPKTFRTAYASIGVASTVLYHTAPGTPFTAEAGIATSRSKMHRGEQVIVFRQNGTEMARAYACCWGHKTNCNRAYIDSYTPAI